MIMCLYFVYIKPETLEMCCVHPMKKRTDNENRPQEN